MINVLKIEFANYFGIKLFHKIYLLKKGNVHLFYAPNGTMKTYFAKTVKFLSGQTKDKPCDQLRTELEPNFSLLADNKVMRKESLFVINGDEELDSSKSFSNFLASAKLKDRYDAIS